MSETKFSLLTFSERRHLPAHIGGDGAAEADARPARVRVRPRDEEQAGRDGRRDRKKEEPRRDRPDPQEHAALHQHQPLREIW